ncbi:MAG: DUF4157 domain-containing protein [Pyrinomonadaceae bacterium]
MKLSEGSRTIFRRFLEQGMETSADRLPDVRVYSRGGATILTRLLLVDGITIGRRVFIDRNYTYRDSQGRLKVSRSLFAHELAHVLQYQREGLLKFLFIYFRDFWRIFRAKKKWNTRNWFEAYQAIPFEIEAREFAVRFRHWLETRDM